jgi:hypothetical protein
MQLTDAADMLGVHYQTAYAWVRQGTLPARKTPRGYEVIESGVCALAARRAADREPPREVRVRDWGAQADRLYTALVAGDETQARHDLERLAAGVLLPDLCDRVIAPALRQIGSAWADGKLPIAAEHRATAICEQLIAARATAARPPARHRGDRDTTGRTACPARHDGGGLPARRSLASPSPRRRPASHRRDTPCRRYRGGPDRAVFGYCQRRQARQARDPKSASSCPACRS